MSNYDFEAARNEIRRANVTPIKVRKAAEELLAALLTLEGAKKGNDATGGSDDVLLSLLKGRVGIQIGDVKDKTATFFVWIVKEGESPPDRVHLEYDGALEKFQEWPTNGQGNDTPPPVDGLVALVRAAAGLLNPERRQPLAMNADNMYSNTARTYETVKVDK